MAHRPQMFATTRGFRGWPIQWNHAKCCGADPCCHGNEIGPRRRDVIAYRLVYLIDNTCKLTNLAISRPNVMQNSLFLPQRWSRVFNLPFHAHEFTLPTDWVCYRPINNVLSWCGWFFFGDLTLNKHRVRSLEILVYEISRYMPVRNIHAVRRVFCKQLLVSEYYYL